MLLSITEDYVEKGVFKFNIDENNKIDTFELINENFEILNNDINMNNSLISNTIQNFLNKKIIYNVDDDGRQVVSDISPHYVLITDSIRNILKKDFVMFIIKNMGTSDTKGEKDPVYISKFEFSEEIENEFYKEGYDIKGKIINIENLEGKEKDQQIDRTKTMTKTMKGR